MINVWIKVDILIQTLAAFNYAFHGIIILVKKSKAENELK